MAFARILVLLACLLGLSGAAFAQGAAGTTFSERLVGWQQVLHRSEAILARKGVSEAEFEDLRNNLTGLIEDAQAAGATVTSTATITQQMVQALGAAPEGGEESESVARERERLNASLAEYKGQAQQAELVATRADILLRTANERRLKEFTETLLRRGPSPLAPSTWAELPDQLPFLRDRFAGAFDAAIQTAANGAGWRRLIELGVIVALSFGVALPLRRWLLRRHGHRPVEVAPSYRQRAAATAVEALARGLIPVVMTVAAAVWLRAVLGDQPTRILPTLAAGIAGGLVFFFFCSGFGHALLAPEHPDWRLADLTAESARRLARRIAAFSAMLAVSGAVSVALGSLLTPPEFEAVVGFATVLLGGVALLSLLPSRLWQREPSTVPAAPCADPVDAPPPAETPQRRAAWPRLRLTTGLITVATIAAAAAGYRTLSIYISELFLMGAAVAGILMVLRGVTLELVQLVICRPSGLVAEMRRTLFPTDRGRKVCDYTARVLLDLCLLFVGLMIVLPASGIEQSELRSWLAAFMRGVEIGGIKIAPADIMAAIVIVTVGILVTRFLQRKVDERILQQLQIDRGVQHSIRTGVGYLGVIIAILAGVGTLGLDLSNLALIAGALSVGIGFGLQTIVSNFVSGLILLVERPVKVGDWVVVGDKEGLVRRISVRATEIQTFQRASVIIPNSELVSKAVVNWTFKDRFGRVDIKIAVETKNDLRKVRDLMLQCAKTHPLVSRTPAPIVAFRDFGITTCEFELRCFVSDVDNFLTVSTDLRFAIADAFLAEGIINGPQKPEELQELQPPEIEAVRKLLASQSRSVDPEAADAVVLGPALAEAR